MCCLEGPWPALEPRCAVTGVREGVETADEEVEGEAPVCEDSKVRKGSARCK